MTQIGHSPTLTPTLSLTRERGWGRAPTQWGLALALPVLMVCSCTGIKSAPHKELTTNFAPETNQRQEQNASAAEEAIMSAGDDVNNRQTTEISNRQVTNDQWPIVIVVIAGFVLQYVLNKLDLRKQTEAIRNMP